MNYTFEKFLLNLFTTNVPKNTEINTIKNRISGISIPTNVTPSLIPIKAISIYAESNPSSNINSNIVDKPVNVNTPTKVLLQI